MSRTDIHRESRLIPANYEHVFSYNLSSTYDNWPVPSYKVNCELDGRHKDPETGEVVNGKHSPDLNCCIVGLNKKGVKWADHGTTGNCTACGAHFIYGDVWYHASTGEYIHTGHICADKMGMLADRSAYEMERNRLRRAAITALQKEKNAEEREAFLAEHPGLKEALEIDHYIIRDIKSRFVQWRNLSEKQIALVFKIADEANNPKPEEIKVPAKILDGRQVIEGEVVSVKGYDSPYGYTEKMLVKIKEPEGHWLTWGSVPSALSSIDKGSMIRFTAKLEQGDEEHFTRFSRPTKSEVIGGELNGT
jgi:hypothetical protein